MAKVPKVTGCFSCVYWSIDVARAYEGECRIKAPSITNNRKWPQTNYCEGCGEGERANDYKLDLRSKIIDAYEERIGTDNGK